MVLIYIYIYMYWKQYLNVDFTVQNGNQTVRIIRRIEPKLSHPLVFTSDRSRCSRSTDTYSPFKLLPTPCFQLEKLGFSFFTKYKHTSAIMSWEDFPIGSCSNCFGTSCQDAWQRTTVDLGLLKDDPQG